MKIKLLPILLAPVAVALTSTVSATNYQTFIDLDYSQIDTPTGNFDGYGIGAQHFFSRKTALGPFGEFDYINTASSVSAAYQDFEGNDAFVVGGELFFNNFVVGLSQQDFYGFDTTTSSFGYLFSDNFLVKVIATNPDDFETSYQYAAQYSHQTGSQGYWGFSYITDEDFDNKTYSTTYFSRLGEAGYLKVELQYDENEFDGYWSAESSYYLNKATALSVALFENDAYGVGFRHFFDKNYSIEANYTNSDDIEIDGYNIRFSMQL